MDDAAQRLTRCFASLFPELDERSIQEATTESVAAWDSIATVTLVNIVEEEFDIRIDFEEVEKLSSFEAFLNYMQTREIAR